MTTSLSPDLALNYLPRLPRRRDWRIGCAGAGFIMRDCHLVAYRQAGFNPVAIASRKPDTAREVAAARGVPRVHDTIDALLTLNAGSRGRVKGDGNAAARVEGGQGADDLDFRVRDYSGGSAGVSAEVDAGADWDHDTVRHTSNVRAWWAFGDEDIGVT